MIIRKQKVQKTIESLSQPTVFKVGFIISLMIGLAIRSPFWPTNAQAQTGEGQAYIVQADDWLSKIADKFYGDALAYPAIVEATNAQAAQDDSFAVIDNPDVIEVGQKLFIPGEGRPASTDSASVAGIYKVMLPGASSPGLDTTLYLNADNTMRQVSDYLNGEPPIVEVGTWQLEGDQVGLTVTGQEGQPYDQASNQTLLLTNEGLMTASAGVGSGYWTFQPFTALALAEATVPYEAAEASQSFSDDGFIGFYKGFGPAASCCGQDITLSLNFDNTASLTTDYLNGEAPLVQTGSWTTTIESSVAVSLAERDAPLALVASSEGLLVTPPQETAYGSNGLQLYRFPVIAVNSLTVDLTGTVSYLQRSALPPQAVLTVQLVDVSKADAPAEVIAEQIIATEGQQPPFNFALPYHPLKIRSNLTYAVQARIEVDGALLFTNVSRYPALSQDAPETIEVMVEPVTN